MKITLYTDGGASKKLCGKCKKRKLLKEFRKNARYKDGVDWWCLECRREYDRNYARKRRADPAHKDRFREYDLRKNFDISLGEYNEMLRAQDGCCAICKCEFGDNHGGPLVVDHDHKWGHVRGLLCRQCNHGLGNFDDNIEYLANAISYLRSTGIKALEEAS